LPFRELGFHGVPVRSSVFLQPTVHCLIQLIDPPFSVLTLGDVEIAYFERVQLSLKNFDLVFVFKNFSFTHINTIPMESLDTIKGWLDSCNIKYYEGNQNLNWARVIETIKKDPESFYSEGGWEMLNTENDDAEESEEEESSDFAPEESVEEVKEESEESAYSGEVDDDEDSVEEGDLEDEAPDWEELEEEAKRQDSERGAFDDERPKSKRGRGEYSDEEEEERPKRTRTQPKGPVKAPSKPPAKGMGTVTKVKPPQKPAAVTKPGAALSAGSAKPKAQPPKMGAPSAAAKLKQKPGNASAPKPFKK